MDAAQHSTLPLQPQRTTACLKHLTTLPTTTSGATSLPAKISMNLNLTDVVQMILIYDLILWKWCKQA
jgi:hypothetical protein